MRLSWLPPISRTIRPSACISHRLVSPTSVGQSNARREPDNALACQLTFCASLLAQEPACRAGNRHARALDIQLLICKR
jgi:hypothetical protein